MDLISSENLVELIDGGRVEFEDLLEFSEKELKFLSQCEGLARALDRGYSLKELAELYQQDPMHLECLTCDDITDVLHEYAPDVPDIVLMYAREYDADFDWVNSELGETDQQLFSLCTEQCHDINDEAVEEYGEDEEDMTLDQQIEALSLDSTGASLRFRP